MLEKLRCVYLFTSVIHLDISNLSEYLICYAHVFLDACVVCVQITSKIFKNLGLDVQAWTRANFTAVISHPPPTVRERQGERHTHTHTHMKRETGRERHTHTHTYEDRQKQQNW